MRQGKDDDEMFDDDRVMRKSGAFRVPVMLMDAEQRAVAGDRLAGDVTDAFGGPVGQRNGYAFPKPGSGLARAHEVAEAVRITEDFMKTEAWKGAK